MSDPVPPEDAPAPDSPPPLPEPQGIPFVAYACIGLCVIIWAGINFDPAEVKTQEWTRTLAPFAPRIWSGQWWGLVSSAFVHIEFWHLLFNMIWTREFGRLLEPRL